MLKTVDLRKEKDEYLIELLNQRKQMDLSNILAVVDEIIANVKNKGDEAVLEYTRKFDKVEILSDELRVSQQEVDAAYEQIDSSIIDVIKRAKNNIKSFHIKQQEKSWFSAEDDGVILGQMYRPLETVGIYVPGGTAPLPSSVLMNTIPAKIAGVDKIIMTTPPNKEGKIDPSIIVAANEAGIQEIYKLGGAQAIAALAFGTKTIPKVDKIVGPGNIYVAMAKKAVYGHCDIDIIAGPSEILIIADETANPAYVAADMLSQAEHDVLASSILITTCEKLASDVKTELKRQSLTLSRREIIERSLADYGLVVLVNTIEDAIEISNKLAPEHLELCVNEPFSLLGSIKSAGAIFLGNYSSEPIGDYYAGPNHVLPTNGTARFFSPLSVDDFYKKSSIISYTHKALAKVKDDIIQLAELEGLTAHANAIRVRFKKDKGKEKE